MRLPLLAAVVSSFVPALAVAGPISLTTSDGVSLNATEYGTGAKGVVLVHDADASSRDWAGFATELSTNGFHVVALDLRGHGANNGPPVEADYALMVHDVSAAATWLAAKGATEVMVLGAGLGGSLALNAAAATPAISGVVVLTPSLNAKGVKVSTAVAGLGNRPLLLVVDQTDTLSAKAATLLAGLTKGPRELKAYPSGGSGTRMLNGVAELEGLLVGWLNGSWKGPEGAQGRELDAGSVSNVETTGTKYEDRGKR